MTMCLLLREGWIWMATAVLGSAVASIAIAQSDTHAPVEFRIDTDVYRDLSQPPVATTQTLFLQNRVVDWDDAQRRMMWIDLDAQRIELADFATQRRCRIDMQHIAVRMRDLRSQLTQDQLRAWSSESEPTENEGSMMLQSGNLRYRFKTVSPPHGEMAVAYAEFADWSAQISAIYPPYKPPLLRLQLNEYLSQRGVLPKEIELTDLRKQSNMTARVLVQDSLTSQDRQRVRDWEVLIQTLKLVPDSEYFGINRLARQRSDAK